MMRNLLRQEGQPTSRLGRKIQSLRLHHLSAEVYVDGLSQASVLNTKWDFLIHLRGRGRLAADAWLAGEFASTGLRLGQPPLADGLRVSREFRPSCVRDREVASWVQQTASEGLKVAL